MHTEDEAKGLWCPMVRHADDNATFNRSGTDGNEINAIEDGPYKGMYRCACIGSACAMWRWGKAPPCIYCDGELQVWKQETGITADGRVPCPQCQGIPPASVGYCGLAGRPE